MLPGMAALLAIAKEELDSRASAACDRCGFCAEACPSELLPSNLALLAQYQDWQGTMQQNIDRCLECGVCSFVCPSRIPLAVLLHEAKEALQPIHRSPPRITNPNPSFSPAISAGKE